MGMGLQCKGCRWVWGFSGRGCRWDGGFNVRVVAMGMGPRCKGVPV